MQLNKSYDKFQLNIIQTGKSNEGHIYNIAKDYFGNRINYININSYSLTAKLPLTLFNSTMPIAECGNQKLTFYYDDYLQHSESYVVLNKEEDDKGEELILGLVGNDSPKANSDMLKLSICTQTYYKRCDMQDNLYAGDFSSTVTLRNWDCLKVSFIRNFNQNAEFPNYKLFLSRPSKSQSFNIPFYYKKRLPKIFCWIFIILEAVTIFFVFDGLLVRVIRWLCLRLLPKFNKRKQDLKSTAENEKDTGTQTNPELIKKEE